MEQVTTVVNMMGEEQWYGKISEDLTICTVSGLEILRKEKILSATLHFNPHTWGKIRQSRIEEKRLKTPG